MADTKSRLSFEALSQETTSGKTYQDVEAYGDLVCIGSLSSEDMIQWIEENEDKTKAREAGLRLLVKSIVDPDTHAHVPVDDRDRYLEIFRKKDSRENSKVIYAVLKLNGLDKAKGADLVKGSGEVSPAASPAV